MLFYCLSHCFFVYFFFFKFWKKLHVLFIMCWRRVQLPLKWSTCNLEVPSWIEISTIVTCAYLRLKLIHFWRWFWVVDGLQLFFNNETFTIFLTRRKTNQTCYHLISFDSLLVCAFHCGIWACIHLMLFVRICFVEIRQIWSYWMYFSTLRLINCIKFNHVAPCMAFVAKRQKFVILLL